MDIDDNEKYISKTCTSQDFKKLLKNINPVENDVVEVYKTTKSNKLSEKRYDNENTIKILEEKVAELERQLEKEKQKNEELESKIVELEKQEQNLNLKDKTINELREKLERYPFELKEDEKMLTVSFSSSTKMLHYSVICKNTDIFTNIENKLYIQYPEYKEEQTFFTVNGRAINKYYTLDENKIKDNDVILLNIIDDEDD